MKISVLSNELINSAILGSPIRPGFSSHPTVIQACHVVPGISDHDAVLFEVNMSPKCPPKETTTENIAVSES